MFYMKSDQEMFQRITMCSPSCTIPLCPWARQRDGPPPSRDRLDCNSKARLDGFSYLSDLSDLSQQALPDLAPLIGENTSVLHCLTTKKHAIACIDNHRRRRVVEDEETSGSQPSPSCQCKFRPCRAFTGTSRLNNFRKPSSEVRASVGNDEDLRINATKSTRNSFNVQFFVLRVKGLGRCNRFENGALHLLLLLQRSSADVSSPSSPIATRPGVRARSLPLSIRLSCSTVRFSRSWPALCIPSNGPSRFPCS